MLSQQLSALQCLERGPLSEMESFDICFHSSNSWEGITAKHPPYSRALLGSAFKAGIEALYALLQL